MSLMDLLKQAQGGQGLGLSMAPEYPAIRAP